MFHLLPLRADVRAERTQASGSSSLRGLFSGPMPPAESSRSRTPLPAYAVTSTAGIDLARLTDGDRASRARAKASGRAGQIADGLVMIEEANARSERTRRMLADCRVAARQRRAAYAAGRTRSRGGGRGSLPAGARLGAPARCPLLGTARRREPCPAAARSGPFRRCRGPPPAGL